MPLADLLHLVAAPAASAYPASVWAEQCHAACCHFLKHANHTAAPTWWRLLPYQRLQVEHPQLQVAAVCSAATALYKPYSMSDMYKALAQVQDTQLQVAAVCEHNQQHVISLPAM